MKKMNVCLFVVAMIIGLLCSTHLSKAADNQMNKDTEVGVGFIEETSGSSPKKEPPIVPKQELPKTRGGNFPQLGAFIEPLIVVLLGLLIWIAVLSILLLNKFLHQKGKS